MENLEVLKIRITAIIRCINDYTSEPSIDTLTTSLTNAIKENNFGVMLFACKEIDQWYQKNIEDILSNHYTYNKNVHRENLQAIKEIVAELNASQDSYRRDIAALTSTPSGPLTLTDTMMVNILNRFHQVVIQMRDRYNSRNTLDVDDEYDVQDLLHALLKLFCEDIRPEEWTPSYAGTSSRQDFLLKNEKIIIETKKTRKGLGNKELANELIIDSARYVNHPDCNKLICFVYDPENRIKNPRGFENDLCKSADGLEIKVFIRP